MSDPLRKGRLWNTRSGNRWLWGGTLLLMMGGVFLVCWTGFSLTGILPPCIFHSFTGMDCPGCGTTRMVAALLDGQWGRAFALNPLMFIAFAALALFYLWFLIRTFLPGWKPLKLRFPLWAAVTLGGILVLYWFLRNTPLYASWFS